MAATKVNANWTGVAYGSVPITRVTAVNFSRGGTLAGFKADTDRFDTIKANFDGKPTMSVSTADVGTVMDATNFAPGAGTAGGTTLTATLKDVRASTGGDVIFALANACVGNVSGSGNHGQFATATIEFEGFSSDGTTSPMAITRA